VANAVIESEYSLSCVTISLSRLAIFSLIQAFGFRSARNFHATGQ
jgi:hypothetical protein